MSHSPQGSSCNSDLKPSRMPTLSIVIVLSIFLATAQGHCAVPVELEKLEGYSFPVLYSKGRSDRARHMAELCERAMAYMDTVLEFRPAMELKVLSAEDWSAHTDFPVYGMPHPLRDTTLILAAEDNAMWRSLLPDPTQLPPQLAAEMRKAYGMPDGSISAQRFFDLLCLHELAHLYHLQRPVKFPRSWSSELFANMFLHTFIAERETLLLPALTVFPTMVVTAGSEEYVYTTLAQLEANYELIATQHPKNYGWYQCKWHRAAADIFDEGGVAALRDYWDLFSVPHEPMDDAELAALLSEKVHPTVARMMISW